MPTFFPLSYVTPSWHGPLLTWPPPDMAPFLTWPPPNMVSDTKDLTITYVCNRYIWPWYWCRTCQHCSLLLVWPPPDMYSNTKDLAITYVCNIYKNHTLRLSQKVFAYNFLQFLVSLTPCWVPFEILSHFPLHQIDFPQLNNTQGNDWPWLVEVGVVADHIALIDGLVSHVLLENRPLITRQRLVIYIYISPTWLVSRCPYVQHRKSKGTLTKGKARFDSRWVVRLGWVVLFIVCMITYQQYISLCSP